MLNPFDLARFLIAEPATASTESALALQICVAAWGSRVFEHHGSPEPGYTATLSTHRGLEPALDIGAGPGLAG